MAEIGNSIVVFFELLSPQLIWNIIVAFLTAFFTVQISLRKFSTQKLWEKKEQTYSNVVGSLSSLLLSLSIVEDHLLKVTNLNGKGRTRVYTKLHQEKEKIELLFHEGTFRISPKSNKALHSLMKCLDLYSINEIDSIRKNYDAVSKCLNIINQEAKKDLGIKKEYYKPWTYFG